MPGFGESLYSLAHYLKVWAGEKELHAETVSLRNTFFINMENLGGNKREKKIPFLFISSGEVGKKGRKLNQNQKRFTFFREKLNKILNIYPSVQTICIYALRKCVSFSVKMKKLKSCEVF